MNPLTQLATVFQSITDSRNPRGVRHNYFALCAAVMLGLIAQITETAQLKTPLGFTRDLSICKDRFWREDKQRPVCMLASRMRRRVFCSYCRAKRE